jgi:hypothetical protein
VLEIRNQESGRRKKEEGRRKKEEGRRGKGLFDSEVGRMSLAGCTVYIKCGNVGLQRYHE